MTWQIKAIQNSDADGQPPEFAIVPPDGESGYIVGELSDVYALFDRLNAFAVTGEDDGEIEQFAQILGHTWLTVAEAESKFGAPRATVTKACRRGEIVGARKQANRWVFPQNSLSQWLAKSPPTPD